MSDRKFTFIELHFDGDTQFGPGSIGEALPIGGSDTAAESDTETDDEVAAIDDESGCTGKRAVGALIALAVLVGIAATVKKFRGGDEEDDLEPEEEPDVIVN